MTCSIAVAITTYNRPKQLLCLLQDLRNCSGGYCLSVSVHDDCSQKDYSEIVEFIASAGWVYLRSPAVRGKCGYWRTINEAFRVLRVTGADYHFLIQDDMRLCDNFLTRSISLWEELDNPSPGILFLLRDSGSESRWTDTEVVNRGRCDLTGWTDCNAFMTTDRFLNQLNWELEPIHLDWDHNPHQSSGVGMQITRRGGKTGLGLFRSVQSMVVHVHGPSEMNQYERALQPLSTVDYVDGTARAARLARGTRHVTASLASIPSRRTSLGEVVAQLLPQVDQLNVYLNDYPDVPAFLNHKRIRVARSQVHGNNGDAGKFFWAAEVSGFHVVCDDDLRYPEDFVDALLNRAEHYMRKVVVGCHGVILRNPFVEYYASRDVFHFHSHVDHDRLVHILGTGCLCYHTDTIRVVKEDFCIPNMADIWFGRVAQKQEVPLVCMQHQEGWVRGNITDTADSIYGRSKWGDDSVKNTADAQTAAVMEVMPWRMFRAAPWCPKPQPPGPAVFVPVRAPVARPTRRR